MYAMKHPVLPTHPPREGRGLRLEGENERSRRVAYALDLRYETCLSWDA